MSTLQQMPPRSRRRLAAMLAPAGVVLLIAAILLLVTNTNAWSKAVGAVVLALSLVLALIITGLRRSARLDESEAALDATIRQASPGCGGDCTNCGTEDCAVKALPRL